MKLPQPDRPYVLKDFEQLEFQNIEFAYSEEQGAVLQGFDTVIGENGIRLSGGQKQRLVIARLLLQNPEVIIFDEVTSALDYKNESEILELLLQNLDQKTFLMVTHRVIIILDEYNIPM